MGGKKTSTKKRTLEDLEAEEKLALSLNDAEEEIDGIAMPSKRRKTNSGKKAPVNKRGGNGRFRMVFVNDLKDAKGSPKRSQLLADDVYINVQHPDFESRVSFSRKAQKLQI